MLKDSNESIVENSIPVSVIDEMIAELKAEKDDCNHIITHSITALELLKVRWGRMQEEANTEVGN